MIRALCNSSGQLQCFIPDITDSGCVTSPEAGGRPSLNGLADSFPSIDQNAARVSSETAQPFHGGCAQPAGSFATPASLPPLPAGDLSSVAVDLCARIGMHNA